ncbi:General negative regulator of transcription subunit 4 [Cytospora mali]|uniref:General negative regulator of transcription subunit 4 n=1 Tax=Cytospora mali TaxID=578113 RepID=A0A194UVI8_CYTMA|nr:General negative regulator of transcription subunit 4 [Valsa mali var. pyri (nom. inval.)]
MGLADSTSPTPNEAVENLVRVFATESSVAKRISLAKHARWRSRGLESWWRSRHGCSGVILATRLGVEGRGHHRSLLSHDARISSQLQGVGGGLIFIRKAVARGLTVVTLALALALALTLSLE